VAAVIFAHLFLVSVPSLISLLTFRACIHFLLPCRKKRGDERTGDGGEDDRQRRRKEGEEKIVSKCQQKDDTMCVRCECESNDSNDEVTKHFYQQGISSGLGTILLLFHSLSLSSPVLSKMCDAFSGIHVTDARSSSSKGMRQ
jgi:hypothetical protein